MLSSRQRRDGAIFLYFIFPLGRRIFLKSTCVFRGSRYPEEERRKRVSSFGAVCPPGRHYHIVDKGFLSFFLSVEDFKQKEGSFCLAFFPLFCLTVNCKQLLNRQSTSSFHIQFTPPSSSRCKKRSIFSRLEIIFKQIQLLY